MWIHASLLLLFNMSAYSMVLLYTSRFAAFRKYCQENDIDVMFTKPLLKREIGFPPHLLKSIPTAFILAIFKQTKYLKARLEKFDSKNGSIETHKKTLIKRFCLEWRKAWRIRKRKTMNMFSQKRSAKISWASMKRKRKMDESLTMNEYLLFKS